MEIRTEITETENTKSIKKKKNLALWEYQQNKFVARLNRKKSEKIHKLTVRNEKENITTDLRDIKNIINEYYEHVCPWI